MRIAVIGGGLAGLAAAHDLGQAGAEVVLLEAEGEVGGRVRTDLVSPEGGPPPAGAPAFRLDRGFQVLLTAYPELQARADLAGLELHRFAPGALVRLNGRFHRVADPFRVPAALLATLRAPVGGLGDKLRVARMRWRLRRGGAEAPFAGPQRSAAEELSAQGISERMVQRFFRPLFGGVLLDPELSTSARMLGFTFRMLAEGDAALPAAGVGALPRQLAEGLPGSVELRTGARVEAIEAGQPRLADGEAVPADAVIVATEGPAFSRLTGRSAPAGRSVACLQFACTQPPVAEPLIVLDGEGQGPVTHMSVPSAVAPGYAPPGLHLVSATVLGEAATALPDAELEARAREQLAGWFGAAVERWQLLRLERIPYGQPVQDPPALDEPYRSARLAEGLYACGDHRAHGSQHGALRSGAQAAAAVLADYGR